MPTDGLPIHAKMHYNSPPSDFCRPLHRQPQGPPPSEEEHAGSTTVSQEGISVDLWESVVMWLFRHFGGLTGAVLPAVRRIAQEVVWEIARDGLPLSDEEKHRTAFFRIQRRAIDAQI